MSETAEETSIMFPELDDRKPEHKKLLAAARKLAKDRGERNEVLTTSKEKVDNSEQKVLDLMHECKLKKFKHEGVSTEIIDTAEKAIVKIENDEEVEDE